MYIAYVYIVNDVVFYKWPNWDKTATQKKNKKIWTVKYSRAVNKVHTVVHVYNTSKLSCIILTTILL